MKNEEVAIVCNKVVNDKNERQSNEYFIYEGKELRITTTDFRFALQCFMNRTGEFK